MGDNLLSPIAKIIMMKRITILLVLFTQISCLFAQNYKLTWQRCFGGSNLEWPYDIVKVENGYFIAGGTGSNDGDISYSYGDGDGWLLRIDSLGNLLWEKTYGGTNSESFIRIIPTLDNAYYLLGSSWSSDGDISYDPYPDSPDYWIVKIDCTGNIIWDKIVGGSIGETLSSGSLTADGGVLAIGNTSSNDGDISVYYGGRDTWIVKISSDGNLEWDYTIGTDWVDYGMDAIQTSDGGYMFASFSEILPNGVGNINCVPHSYGYYEGVLFKLDKKLNIEWQRCYGGSNSDNIYRIQEIDSGYIFTGRASSNDGDISGWHSGYDHLGYPTSDIWIVKIDYEGNIIRQNCFGGSGDESASILLPTEDNGFAAFGVTTSYDGDVSGNHSSSEYDSDIWLIKLNSEGELTYQQCIGGARKERIDFGVVKKNDYDFIIAGQTNYGPSYDVQCTPHGQLPYNLDTDFWVFEIKDCSYYAPAVPAAPCGADTVCSGNGNETVFSTTAAANASSYEWQLAPEEAGTVAGDSLTAAVTWAVGYEGTATLVVRSTNDCGQSAWSDPKYTQVNTCLGTEETAAAKAGLKVYPNPAKDYIVFELSTTAGNGKAEIILYNAFGQPATKLKVKEGRTVWHTVHMPAGLYYYKTEINGTPVSGKVVVRD